MMLSIYEKLFNGFNKYVMYILRINTIKVVCEIFCSYLVMRSYNRVLRVIGSLGCLEPSLS